MCCDIVPHALRCRSCLPFRLACRPLVAGSSKGVTRRRPDTALLCLDLEPLSRHSTAPLVEWNSSIVVGFPAYFSYRGASAQAKRDVVRLSCFGVGGTLSGSSDPTEHGHGSGGVGLDVSLAEEVKEWWYCFYRVG